MFRTRLQQIFFQNLNLFAVFFGLLLLHFFLNVGFVEFENGVYLKYLISILHDLDFNIYNQFSDSMNKWMVTTKYNHPDYHSPFLSTFLLIPYALSSLFPGPFPNYTTYFLAYLFAIIMILNKKEPAEKYKRDFLITFLCSCGIVYFIFEPGEPSLFCLPFAYLIFSDLVSLDKRRPIMVQTLISLYLFVIFKPDSFLWVIPVTLFFAYFSSKKDALKCVLVTCLGLIQLKLIDFVRYGPDFTSNPVLQFENNYLFEHLLGPVGLFHLQPIYLVGIIGLALGALKNEGLKERLLCVFSLSILMGKIILISFMMTPVIDTQAGRNFLTELPLIAFGLRYLYRSSSLLFAFLILICAFVNLYHIEVYLGSWLDPLEISGLEYISERPLFSFSGIGTGVAAILEFYRSRFSGYDTLYVLTAFSTSLMLSIVLVFTTRLLQKTKYYKRSLKLMVILSLVFASLNLVYNQKNTKLAIQRNEFSGAVVASHEARYYDEVMYLFYLLKRESDLIKSPTRREIHKLEEQYLLKVIKNVHRDPIGFVPDLKMGIIRESFWSKLE